VCELTGAKEVAEGHPEDSGRDAAEILAADGEVGGELGDACGGAAAVAIAEVMGDSALDALAIEVRKGVCAPRHRLFLTSGVPPCAASLPARTRKRGEKFRAGSELDPCFYALNNTMRTICQKELCRTGDTACGNGG